MPIWQLKKKTVMNECVMIEMWSKRDIEVLSHARSLRPAVALSNLSQNGPGPEVFSGVTAGHLQFLYCHGWYQKFFRNFSTLHSQNLIQRKHSVLLLSSEVSSERARAAKTCENQ